MTDHLHTTLSAGLACITLDRPRALNALSLAMIRSMTAALQAWRDDPAVAVVVVRSSMGRAFCAGGDIRYFHEVASATPRGGSLTLEDFFTEEYALNHLIHHYPKPYVALMDGVVMGGGMGISQGSPTLGLRVVTERTRMAMPEVGIGLFPDVGGSYFLSRVPAFLGRYLALTGHTIGGADAIHAGLADLLVPFEDHAGLLLALAGAGRHWRTVLEEFAVPAPPSPLALQQATIARHFALDDVAAIMASLATDTDEFAVQALASMRLRSPAMLCVTLEQLRRGAGMPLADCLRMERTMVRHCFERGDVVEGIRAAVIDKDHAPQWQPATLAEVDTALVASFFAPVWPAAAHPLRDLR